MRAIGKFILWLFAILGLLSTALVAAVVLFSLSVRDKIPELAEGSILTLDWNRQIPEHRATEPVFPDRDQATLLETVQAIGRAADRPEITGLTVTLGRTPFGFAEAQELADAIRRFRQSGKPAYVFAEDLATMGDATSTMMLVSAFDQVWLQPSGSVGLTGISLEIPFAADALEEVGIEAEFEQRHEFKGGADPFIRNRMPIALRRSLQGAADGLLEQVVSSIAADRDLTPDAVRALVDNGPHLAREALAADLIDRTGYESDFWNFVDQEFSDPQRISAPFLLAATEPEETAARIAVLYGVGPIGLPDDGVGPFSDRGFDPDSVVATLDAIADGSIEADAVLFRVVSPGGAYGPSDTVWNAVGRVRDAGIPVVVSMGDIAASGGYFVSANADRIIARPGTLTGSIGVYGGMFDASELWRSLGVRWEQVTAGANAGMWSFNRGFDQLERGRFANAIDFVYEDFTTKVAEGRGLDATQLDAAARGRIWLGSAAQSVGLVDKLGGFEEAFSAIRSILELEPDSTLELVILPEPLSPFDILVEAAGRGDFQILAGAVLADSIEERLRERTRTLLGSSVLLTAPAGLLSAPPIEVQGRPYGYH